MLSADLNEFFLASGNFVTCFMLWGCGIFWEKKNPAELILIFKSFVMKDFI